MPKPITPTKVTRIRRDLEQVLEAAAEDRMLLDYDTRRHLEAFVYRVIPALEAIADRPDGGDA